MVKEPGQDRPDETGDTAPAAARRATGRAPRHGVRLLHAHSRNNSDENGSTVRQLAARAATTPVVSPAGTNAITATMLVLSRHAQHARHPEKSQQFGFYVRKSFPSDGTAGNHDKLDVRFQFMFVQPVCLAQQPSRAIAPDGIANLAARHHPHRPARRRGTVRRFVQQVQRQQTAFDLAAALVNLAELMAILEPLAFRKCVKSMQPDLSR